MITLESLLAQAKVQIDSADENDEVYVVHAEALILKNAGASVTEKRGALDIASSGRHFELVLNGMKFTHTCYPGSRNCEEEPLV